MSIGYFEELLLCQKMLENGYLVKYYLLMIYFCGIKIKIISIKQKKTNLIDSEFFCFSNIFIPYYSLSLYCSPNVVISGH